ncbi:MAG: extracellular solute-binding protein, partial [Christensenellaceae bacterium]|nr:extracellular solute-binding protein [Christensenellaceae bacterium]
LFDDDGNPVMADDPKTKAAFEFVVKAMNTDKIVDPGSLTADYETVANVFCTGGSAFILQAWPGVYALANDPESSSIVDQIAVADVAVHAKGEKQVVLTLPEAMAIPKTSKNKDAAWKYIEYMSSKEFDKQRAETIGELPIWTDLFSDADLLAKYPYWKNFAGQIASSRGLPNLTWYDEYGNVLMTEVQKMLLGQISVEEGLKSIQEQCIALKQENS